MGYAMKKKINIGLIGTGRLGKMYAEFLAHRVPGANLIAVADLIPDRANQCAAAYEVHNVYYHHQDLNADKNVEAVIVTATTVNHKEIVINAAENGKPVFCEKPMTLNLDEAREMKKVIEKTAVFYQQGYMRRFDPGQAAAKVKIDAGEIGKPVVFRGSSRDPYLPEIDYLRPENSGGQILDMAIHDIDIARWYMGDIASIYAIGGVLAYPEVEATGDTDNVIMMMKFANGTLGEIDISRNGIYGYDIRAEVLGTKGTLQVGYLRETPLLLLTANNVSHDVVPYFPERFGQAYISQLNDFIQNLIQEKEPMITIDDGIAGLQVAVAATASLKKNTMVQVKDF
jgi:scyllo-inositol 2-dehydrogenase (NAD+)